VLDRYICEQCRRRYRGSGMCPDHPEEPLLDLADPEIRLLLDKDDGPWHRGRAGVVGLLVASALYMAFMVVATQAGLHHALVELGAEALAVVAAIATGVYVSKVPVAAPRPILDAAEVEALEAARRWEEDLALAPAARRSPRPRRERRLWPSTASRAEGQPAAVLDR
jgi:hypothetical protein